MNNRLVVPGLLAVVLVGALAGAQPPLREYEPGAQLRDAAFDAAGNVYVAVYDRNEIWRLAPDSAEHSAEPAAKAAVGRGPVAIAVSDDGAFVASVNNLSSDVTLLKLPGLEPVATVPCPKGPSAIAALPGGRFAVASSFSGSVTVINANAPAEGAALAGSGPVPISLAESGGLLAVGTRVTSQVLIYSAADLEALAANTFDGAPPVSICDVGHGQFAVAGPVLQLLDGSGAKPPKVALYSAVDVASDGEKVYALTGTSVVVFDKELQKESQIDVPQLSAAIAANADRLIVLAPKSGRYYVGSLRAETAALPTAESAPVTAAPDVPAAQAPGPAAIPIPTEPAPSAVEALPAPAPAPEPVSPPPAAIPIEEAEEAPAPKVEAAATVPVSADDSKEATPLSQPYRQMPLIAPDVRAPQPGARPPASPLIGVRHPSLRDALTERLEFAPQEAFKEPDWTQPLRDVSADSVKSTFGQEEVVFEGNVRLRLDTLDFFADRLVVRQLAGEYHAAGDVLIRQDQSMVAADEIFYNVPAESDLPQARVIEPFMTEQQRARKRLSSGTVFARMLEMEQPNQELVADELTYNFAESAGEMKDARGRAAIYYFGAENLRVLGPASIDGEDVWVTTCNLDPPHYRIRMKAASIRNGQAVFAKGAQLQLGNWNTPIYWPQWGYRAGARGGSPLNLEFDSGHRANIGYYVNIGQQFQVTRDLALGVRLYPTTKEGVGFGFDGDYNFTQTPSSPLFLSKGKFNSLWTTEERGYLHLTHQQLLDEDTNLLVRAELWSDREFYKDFYYDLYQDRTAPRTFVNVTHTEDTHIASATVRPNPHGFVRDTERLPEASWHWLDHRIANNLYFSFDTVAGYNRVRRGPEAVRWVNVGRLTYDINLDEALNLTPFYEMDITMYSENAHGESSDARFANTVGATLQTRLHREFDGIWNFSGFKHVVLPSVTVSYRPEPTMGVIETPVFDAYDDAFGRGRIETKLDNILFGRDAATKEVWQVARLTLYQGNDFWNELSESNDYEAELDVRPRAWWGCLLAAEHHAVNDDLQIDDPYFVQRTALRFVDDVLGIEPSEELEYRYDPRYGSYDRLLTYVYYDGMPLNKNYNAHVGFAYTETQDRVYNREVLYGAGYKLGEKWGVAFEHRYDFERNELSQQKYEIRRNLHCWEAALLLQERNEGWDIGVSFNIVAFPGTKLKF